MSFKNKYFKFEAHTALPVIHTYFFRPWYGKPERIKGIPSIFITYKKDESGVEHPFLYELEFNFRSWGMPYRHIIKEDELYVIVSGYLQENPTKRVTILCAPISNFNISELNSNRNYKRLNESSAYKGLSIEIRDSKAIIQTPLYEQSNDIIQCVLNTDVEIESIRTYIKILNNEYFHSPTVEDVATKLEKIFHYVENIDIEKTFGSYLVEMSGQYVRRVGKDDHYHYQITKSLDSNDEYIRSLFDLKNIDDYYSCNVQSEEEKDVKNQPQYNDIKWAITDAKRKYTIFRHVSFYLLKLFSDFENREKKYATLKKSIQKLYKQKKLSELFSEVVTERYQGYGIDIDMVNRYINDNYTYD